MDEQFTSNQQQSAYWQITVRVIVCRVGSVVALLTLITLFTLVVSIESPSPSLSPSLPLPLSLLSLKKPHGYIAACMFVLFLLVGCCWPGTWEPLM